MRVVPTAGPPGWIRFGPSTRMDFLFASGWIGLPG